MRLGCADADIVLTLLSPDGVATFTYAECRAKAAELVQRLALERGA